MWAAVSNIPTVFHACETQGMVAQHILYYTYYINAELEVLICTFKAVILELILNVQPWDVLIVSTAVYSPSSGYDIYQTGGSLV